MNGEGEKTATTTSRLRDMTELERYGCGPIQFTGTNDALYERHLLFDNVIDLATVGPRERYEAVARSVRAVLSQRWLRTEQTLLIPKKSATAVVMPGR
jgi:starch phosphorylase